ncbi:hypothetical protein SCP_1600040 [Sparassis crispa]|uniref:Mitochondrial K+-H+ exchange-related-domain-containing protein n=1 Tax=Sparassis crispa TaxID=139825 RepID=A0A401H4L1_9APHY|nr:hypothetical protein SCP_1600040 [Sparassis crispa]GBE89343.1 hypothetical protein SCP_1600040 [Sparassis crispa]
MAGAVSTSKRALRIIALPLTNAPLPTLASQSPAQLTYYHFLTPPLSAKERQGFARRAITKASQLWEKLGKAEESSWKRKTFLYGERLMNRLDFEELALQSVDPSLGPKILSRSASSAPSPSPRDPDHPTIPLVYPPSARSSPLQQLRTLLEKRTPRHRRGFITWLLIAPLTSPFILVPVIPNFPFFFCAWRSWSHYRAYKASQYLEEFLDQGAIVPEASSDLDAIYAEYSPKTIADREKPPTDGDANLEADVSLDLSQTPVDHRVHKPPNPEPKAQNGENPNGASLRLILTPAAVPPLAARLGLSPDSSFTSNMYRALEQASRRSAEAREP